MNLYFTWKFIEEILPIAFILLLIILFIIVHIIGTIKDIFKKNKEEK